METLSRKSSCEVRFTTQYALANLPNLGSLVYAWCVANHKSWMVGFTVGIMHGCQKVLKNITSGYGNHE